ncbi:hypothetical protein FRACA_440022 [Frankia canadensis]|uniref:Uncharacterized protein n=1 Tax=Frankia canadensis TaxID=1836972 RepID=A0A2I2KXD2_9ACTN|nr:hypothetical protein FRACA_440022 [Frankia canadensis]SOU57615.1 hypothetical protein FRACA_440022 [Frankia canadensis]
MSPPSRHMGQERGTHLHRLAPIRGAGLGVKSEAREGHALGPGKPSPNPTAHFAGVREGIHRCPRKACSSTKIRGSQVAAVTAPRPPRRSPVAGPALAPSPR